MYMYIALDFMQLYSLVPHNKWSLALNEIAVDEIKVIEFAVILIVQVVFLFVAYEAIFGFGYHRQCTSR